MNTVLYTEKEGEALKIWPDTYPSPSISSMPKPPGGKESSIRVNGIRFHSILWERGTRWDAVNGFTHRSDKAIKRLVRATISGGLKACKEYLE